MINQLSRVTPRVSPHFPWDKVSDFAALREEAASLGLGFDAVNSNTFQDQPGQAHTYANGSLSSQDAGARRQAVEHNIECIEIGRQLGSTDLTVWVGDGTNFPGQQDFARSLDRYLDAASEIYAALPDDWRMLLEHKMFEPAFLFDRDQRLGQFDPGRPGTGPQGQVPGGSWAPRAQREHRADRCPAPPLRQARRVPLQ